MYENVNRDISLDMEVLVKFWKSSGSGLPIRTPDSDWNGLGGSAVRVLVYFLLSLNLHAP